MCYKEAKRILIMWLARLVWSSQWYMLVVISLTKTSSFNLRTRQDNESVFFVPGHWTTVSNKFVYFFWRGCSNWPFWTLLWFMVQYPRIQDHKTDHIERVISYIYALRDLSHLFWQSLLIIHFGLVLYVHICDMEFISK